MGAESLPNTRTSSWFWNLCTGGGAEAVSARSTPLEAAGPPHAPLQGPHLAGCHGFLLRNANGALLPPILAAGRGPAPD